MCDAPLGGPRTFFGTHCNPLPIAVFETACQDQGTGGNTVIGRLHKSFFFISEGVGYGLPGLGYGLEHR